MAPSFTARRCEALPALAFAAEIRADGSIEATCGSDVEIDGDGLIAGAWAGDFAGRGIATASTSVGTALRLIEGRAVAVVGTASSTSIAVSRVGPRIIVSNSMGFALAAAGDEVATSYPFYPQDIISFAVDAQRYRRFLPTRRGTLALHYGSTVIAPDGTTAAWADTPPPPFPDYAAYRGHLLAETSALFANCADPGRRRRYTPLAGISAGYDSPAAAVIAREAGCREGFTFRQPHDGPASEDDNGVEIGRRLGLAMTEHDTFAFRDLPGQHDIEYIAASFSSGQVYLAALGDRLGGRIMVTGNGGDMAWSRHFGERQTPHFPSYRGGYSHAERLLRAPALDLAMGLVGASRYQDVGAISRSAELAPWSVGGSYDRPIPRRIIEEAGIPRGSFATAKRRVTLGYDNLARRAAPIAKALSADSATAFEKWFAVTQPIDRMQALRHRLLVDSVGRLFWSQRLAAALGRFGLRWPPWRVGLLRLRTPIRKNAFVFNWALGIQTARYRAALEGTHRFAGDAPVGD